MKYESLGQTTSCWEGQDKQGRYNMEESWQSAQSNPRTRLDLAHSQGAARNSRSSMYKMYIGIRLQFIERKRLGCYQYNSLFMFYYLFSLLPE